MEDTLFDTLADVSRTLRSQGQHAAALWIWRHLEGSFPEAYEPPYEAAQALRDLGKLEDAVNLLRTGATKFPAHASLFIAIEKAIGVQADRTPVHSHIFSVSAKTFLAQAELPQGTTSEAVINNLNSINETRHGMTDRDLVMQFESLGGAGHGCEFGLFQRRFEAEPLGLLRWADLSADLLASALESRFEGVGEPENTVIFVPNGDEYWTRDTRYWMAMRSFIAVKEAPMEQMTRKVSQRQKFLTRKLISDLQQSTKIFVFKDMRRVLPAETLDRLYSAIRTYGDSTLFYIRFGDPSHPNGTVIVDRPGLMIGYIDHFAFSPDEVKLDFPYDSWRTLCERAYDLWIDEAQATRVDILPLEQDSHRSDSTIATRAMPEDFQREGHAFRAGAAESRLIVNRSVEGSSGLSEEFHINRHGMEKHVEVRHPLFARAMDELYWPHPCSRFVPQSEKEKLYTLAAELMGTGPMTYLEFGVYGGWSFSRVLEAFTNPESRFYGFDSFGGLPEAWGEMDVGHFSTGDKIPDIEDNRASFVKGWFQNTVPSFLKSNPISTPVLIHFDADLYSSTLFLLTTLWHSIPDYWFIFDEFQPDEIIAMHDFTRAFPVSFQFIACTANEYNVPQQVLGRLKTIEFSL